LQSQIFEVLLTSSVAINGKKTTLISEKNPCIMFLHSTMGFERLQHTQNIHGGDDMGQPSQFTIHLTNLKTNTR